MKPGTQNRDYTAVSQKTISPLTKLDSITSQDASFEAHTTGKGVALGLPVDGMPALHMEANERQSFWRSRRGRITILVGASITGCLVLAGIAVGIWAAVTHPGRHHDGNRHCTKNCMLPPQIDVNARPFGDNPQMQQVRDCGALLEAMQLKGGANLAWGARNTFGIGFGSIGRAGGGMVMDDRMGGAAPATGTAGATQGSAADFSGTNVQVEGVDESDIVKTDGQFIYVASGGQLIITRVTGAPASISDVNVVSRTNVTEALLVYGEGGCSFTYTWDNVTRCGSRYGLASSFQAAEMLLHNDVLLLLGSALEASTLPEEAVQAWGSAYNATRDPYLARRTFPTTAAVAWDVSNRTAPKLLRVTEVEGYFATGRLVAGVAYIAVSTTPHVATPTMMDGPVSTSLARWQASVAGGSAEQLVMPHWRSMDDISTSDFAPLCNCSQVSFPPNITSQSFTTVLGIAMEAGTYDTKAGNTAATRSLQAGEVVGQTTVAGPWSYGSPAIMASATSMYMAVYYVEYSSAPPPPGSSSGTMTSTAPDQGQVSQGSLLLAFSLSRGLVNLRNLGQVPGNLVSQWAMDEYGGALRVATTVGPKWMSNGQTVASVSGVFVLNATSMQQVGNVVGLGVGERIYSVRFMGGRGYVVTFRQTDPLYVLDLVVPSRPAIVGEVKIPGFSEYLHPVGNSMLLGVGRGADDTGSVSGLKLSLFDVSNPAKPLEAATLEMGGPGSMSDVARDHKALMYIQPDSTVNRAVFSVPMTLTSTSQGCGMRTGSRPVTPAFQGAIVYELTWAPGKGAFKQITQISHLSQEQRQSQWNTTYNGESITCNIWCEAARIRRSVRVGSVLYTMSDSQLVASRFEYTSTEASGYGEQLWSGELLKNTWMPAGQPQPCWIYTAMDS